LPDGTLTKKGKAVSCPELWGRMKSLLPDLNGLRVLDIGCNAGGHCVYASLEGAEVVGIESDKKFFRQALVIRDIFNVDVWYINEPVGKWIKELGKFDVVFAISILYHLENLTEVLESILEMTNLVLVRTRDDRLNLRDCERMFLRRNFVLSKSLRENNRHLATFVPM
jgi:tRNA (mo5U34)-methyltransferase